MFVQLAAFVIIAPYIAAGGRYDYVFEQQPKMVSIPWFGLFQAVSAFSNTGMSLVDLSMIPFQTAYVMIFGMCWGWMLLMLVLIILILAGNTALVCCLKYE